METNINVTKKLQIGIGGVLAALTAVAVFLIFSPEPSEPQGPAVHWTPSSLGRTVPAGNTIEVPVSFAANRDLKDVVIRVVPELADLVSVAPSDFGDVRKGQTLILTIVIAPSAMAAPETLDGVIQLRNGGETEKVYPKPLPVAIEVWEALSFPITGGNLNVGIPPGWTAESSDDNIVLISPATASAYETLGEDAVEIPADIGIGALANPDGLSLSSFVAGFAGTYYENYAAIEEGLVSGRPMVRYDDGLDELSQAPVLAAFIDSPPEIVLVTFNKHVASADDEALFDLIVETIGLP